ncbi:uncharacterized protein [Miscanthus floridulus]|uniref:uncharacterized protein n=1 Tax=Miscanthus floridulus TaxID=154761 RepID=UPI0034585A0C
MGKLTRRARRWWRATTVSAIPQSSCRILCHRARSGVPASSAGRQLLDLRHLLGLSPPPQLVRGQIRHRRVLDPRRQLLNPIRLLGPPPLRQPVRVRGQDQTPPTPRPAPPHRQPAATSLARRLFLSRPNNASSQRSRESGGKTARNSAFSLKPASGEPLPNFEWRRRGALVAGGRRRRRHGGTAPSRTDGGLQSPPGQGQVGSSMQQPTPGRRKHAPGLRGTGPRQQHQHADTAG